MNYLEKLANSLETGLDVELGSGTARGIANSVGRVSSVLNLLPVVVKNNLKTPYDEKLYKKLPTGPKRYQILEDDERGNLYKSLADAMYDTDPESLSDTKVYLGGASVLDRLKRVWKNRRTTLLTKLLGTGMVPASSIYTNLMRSDHYEPISDSVTLFSDNPAVLTHELGHAIDFNKLRNPAKDPEAKSRLAKVWRAIKNEVKSTPRDLYTFQRAFMGKIAPFTTLYQETAANKRSLDNINKLKEEHPELVDAIKKLRTKQLPAAWSTYALGGTGVLTGLPAVLTAGGIRTATSTIDNESFNDLYSKLKDALKEYKKKRKGDPDESPNTPDKDLKMYVARVDTPDNINPDTKKILEYLARKHADYLTLKSRGRDEEAEKLREETMHMLPSEILAK